jgi:hypothetical protein
MKLIGKLLLFISAYVPLFTFEAAIIVRPPGTFTEALIYALLLILSTISLGSLFWQYLIWHAKDQTPRLLTKQQPNNSGIRKVP